MKYLILLAAFAALLSSCHVQKHSTVKTDNRDSIAAAELSRKLAETIRERDFFAKKVEELEYLAITFAECPPPVNLDSLKTVLAASGCRSEDIAILQDKLAAVQSKFERAADGSIKAEGRLASVTISNKKLVDSLHERNAEVIRLKSELAIAKTQVKSENKEDEREVSRGWPWWIWFTIGLEVGIVLVIALIKWVWNGDDDDTF